MSSKAYFAQYTSPNIIIVPTVSFSPPRAEGPETAANISFTAGTSKINSVNYNNLKIVVEPHSDGGIWSAGASDILKCQMFKQQDSDTMERPPPPTNASQGNKELSSSLYKSRNNLVDLTGFNILKRDSISSTKNKNDLNIKYTTKSSVISDDSKQFQRDVAKKATNSKECTETQVSGEFSRKNTQTNEPKQSATDMKDTMKKYFRHLWKRNMEKKLLKTKENPKNEKQEIDPKRNKPKDENIAKDLTLPSQSKLKLKRDSLVTKSLQSKTKDLKRRTDLKRKVNPEYIKTKSEIKSSITTKKTSSPISPSHNHGPSTNTEDIERDKNFQRFLQGHKEQKSIKLNKVATATKKIAAQKQNEKSEVHSKEKKNINTTKSINAVINNKDIVTNKNIKPKQALRPNQSRKRPRNDLKTEQDNYVITLEQGVKLNSKASTKHVAPVKTSKPKKCKRIKLVINIECPSSDESDDSESGIGYSQPSPQDLTFLDDFNVDEIVDSLNSCRDTVECNKITSPINEHTKTNKIISKTQVAKKKLINDFNIKVRTDLKKEEVIIINSDSENDESGSGKGVDAARNDRVKTMEICSNDDKSNTNNIVLKESNKFNNKLSQQLNASDKCIKKSDIKGKNSKVCLKTRNKTFTKSNQNIKVKIPLQDTNEKRSEKISKLITNSKKDISLKTLKQKYNINKHNTPVENYNELLSNSEEYIEENKICSLNKKDEIEMSLESMFNDAETKPEIPSIQSDDIIEKTLKTMFSSTKDSDNIQICVKSSIPNEYSVKEETMPLQNLEDDSIVSLDKLCDINQCLKTKIDSASVNKEQILTKTISSTEDSDDIKNDITPKIYEYVIKEQTISLPNSGNTFIDPHEKLSDDQNLDTKMDIEPVNANNQNINEIGILQESAKDNNLAQNTVDQDKTAKNTVDINIEATSLQGTKQEEENDNTEICHENSKQSINALQNQIENSQPKANINKENNLINTSNIETIDIKEKNVGSIESIESVKNICIENNEIQVEILKDIHNSNSLIETAVDDTKTNPGMEKTSDANEQGKNIALKTNERVTETPLKIEETPIFKEKPDAQKAPVKNMFDRKCKAINMNNHSRYKKEGFNKSYNTEEGQIKSVVTVNNTTDPKANNNNTKLNDLYKKDAPVYGDLNTSIDNNEEIITTKEFTEKLETRMFHKLHTTFKISSIIHNGSFSVIYKCKDGEDVPYAVKVLKQPGVRKGHMIARMVNKIQNYTSMENSNVLFMFRNFVVSDNWCFLTEYYTRNLKQALIENKRTFHINAVQNLASQLVAAVALLTGNNIIHTDIKPEHVLLNASNSKLKLCGFDRCMYSDKTVFLPNTGTAGYRAPEIILGYPADCRIDVWATALVMFEMATSIKLFRASYNNDLLYKQMCAFGSFDSDMINASKFRFRYFSGTSFVKRVGRNGQNIVLIHAMHRNNNLEKELYMAYRLNWQRRRTEWQATEDLDKLERFHALLKQMLALDPRYRLPIQFIGASEFFHDLN